MDMEREFDDKALSRDRDPVVPRGAVVAGEAAVPRRIDLRRNTPAEIAIRDAVYRVEEMGADPTLTDVVVLLQDARERVADFVDGIKSVIPSYERDALEARLEECRGVVRAAIVHRAREPRTSHLDIVKSVDTLSTTTRAWAEGSGEEEG